VVTARTDSPDDAALKRLVVESRSDVHLACGSMAAWRGARELVSRASVSRLLEALTRQLRSADLGEVAVGVDPPLRAGGVPD
jgi:hypothetical protein